MRPASRGLSSPLIRLRRSVVRALPAWAARPRPPRSGAGRADADRSRQPYRQGVGGLRRRHACTRPSGSTGQPLINPSGGRLFAVAGRVLIERDLYTARLRTTSVKGRSSMPPPPGVAGFCCPSRLCRLEPSLQPLHGLSVARKHQGLAFRESVIFASLLGPHLG